MGPKKQHSVAAPSTKAEREADLVMGTNNSSIVSKRSVEMFYYPEPHFFRYFVKKPQRRSPLINRGYWLRMYTMMESVRRFMKESSEKPKFVLNLGCGFDPLPFMLLSANKSLCRETRFVDIDYEKLMVNKKTAMQRTKEITELLDNVEFLSDENAVQIRSDHYLAIGCDLKNLKKLDDTLKTEVLPAECSVLCLAEVSLTYMDIESANAVVNWASKLRSDVQFCILEQFFPDGPQHPFASTMMKHFNKLGAPLYSIHEYPSLHEQEQRFKNAGWIQAHARSLWDLWSDDEFLSSSTRTSLDTVESFDEWEEFALFASHYFLLHASTRKQVEDHDSEMLDDSEEPSASDDYALIPHISPACDQRRYGAPVPDSDRSLGHHGGLGRQTRLASTSLYSPSEEITNPSHPFPPTRDIPARMCHTTTALKDNCCLLAGGRTSPAGGFQDCWLREGNQWKSIHSLPEPRYRHNAVRLLPRAECVLVYGGKTSNGQVLDSWILWSNDEHGWRYIETNSQKPPARFGACLESINDTTGVLFGGIGKDNTILEDFWTWKLSQRSDGSFYLDLIEQTKKLLTSPLFKYTNRFGATVTRTAWGLVIAGGIIPRQIVSKDKEILLLNSTKLLNYLQSRDNSIWSNRLISTIGLGADFHGPQPLLTGHVACAVHPDQVLFLGGGAVCFSFGTFWTEGTWLLHRTDSAVLDKWKMVPESIQPEKKPATSALPSTSQGPALNKVDKIPVVPRVKVQEAAQFQQVLADGKPVVIEGSDLGPCTELWTNEYIANAVGSDRKVIVHEAQSEHMSFQAKNFSYTTKGFGAFLDEVHAGGRQYLRSISAEQPSKLPASLASDFPNLHRDFQLPAPLSFVTENAHSSPLRISGPVTLWLHYDVSVFSLSVDKCGCHLVEPGSDGIQVMANVLCQIRGERRLILFSPGDVQHLHVPAGASSSNVDIFQDTDGTVNCPPATSPQEAVLQPGDILFIPPLWLHTASPAGQTSVAVNIFFRSLSTGYAPGRDVYGNRDLQAYENGRNNIQKIAKSFGVLPPDISRFYLLRLAQELKDLAEV